MTEYDDPIKDLAWQSWFAAYERAAGVEEIDAVTQRTAQSQFERFWERNTTA